MISDVPALSWERVLHQPIRRLLEEDQGVDGASYATVGIEFESGDVLNLGCPGEMYGNCRPASTPRILNDLDGSRVRKPAYVGMTLKSLIYCNLRTAGRHYFAVLETGDYLTRYHVFNSTEVGLASFGNWRNDDVSRLFWGTLRLRSKRFFNALSHAELDPFSLYG